MLLFLAIRQPLWQSRIPSCSLDKPGTCRLLAAPFDQQESNPLIWTAQNHATQPQQTLPRICRAGGPQEILQPQRGGGDAEEISADKIRSDCNSLVPSRGRSETVRSNGTRDMSSS